MLREIGIPWREDSSNHNLDVVRNRIRHELLPALREAYNPRITEALVRLARSAALYEDWAASEADRWYQDRAQSLVAQAGLRLRNWAELPPALGRRVLRLAAAHFQIQLTEEQLDRAAESDTAWPRRHTVVHQGADVVVYGPWPRVDWPPVQLVPTWPGRLALPVGSLVVEGPVQDPGPDGISGELDRLRVRGWEPGDRIQLPAGQRKLQDLFVDRKVPRRLRHAWPIVADVDGSVVAVPGLAVDVRWRAAGGGLGYLLRWERASG